MLRVSPITLQEDRRCRRARARLLTNRNRRSRQWSRNFGIWNHPSQGVIMSDQRRTAEGPRVAVTEMSGLLYCETQTALRFKHGKRVSPASARASARGDREHDRHDHNARRFHRRSMETSDRRCFVATAVYGPDSWQVGQLRQFRDAVLLPHEAGRAIVAGYYRVSPTIARWLERSPRARRLLRRLLDRMVTRLIRARRLPHE